MPNISFCFSIQQFTCSPLLLFLLPLNRWCIFLLLETFLFRKSHTHQPPPPPPPPTNWSPGTRRAGSKLSNNGSSVYFQRSGQEGEGGRCQGNRRPGQRRVEPGGGVASAARADKRRWLPSRSRAGLVGAVRWRRGGPVFPRTTWEGPVRRPAVPSAPDPAEEPRSASRHGGRAPWPAAHGAPGRLGRGGGSCGGGGRPGAGRAAAGAEPGAAHDSLQLDAGVGGRVDAEIVSVPARPARHTALAAAALSRYRSAYWARPQAGTRPASDLQSWARPPTLRMRARPSALRAAVVAHPLLPD